jgi:hypothetical protein
MWGYRRYTAGDNTFSDDYGDERSTEREGDGAALTEFVTAIREDRPPIADIHDAVRTMTLYQAIFDAYQAGRQGPLDLQRAPGPRLALTRHRERADRWRRRAITVRRCVHESSGSGSGWVGLAR